MQTTYPYDAWSRDEDIRLRHEVRIRGLTNWRAVAATLPNRSADSCRIRYHRLRAYNLVDDDRSLRHRWTIEEDAELLRLRNVERYTFPRIEQHFGRPSYYRYHLLQRRVQKQTDSNTREQNIEVNSLSTANATMTQVSYAPIETASILKPTYEEYEFIHELEQGESGEDSYNGVNMSHESSEKMRMPMVAEASEQGARPGSIPGELSRGLESTNEEPHPEDQLPSVSDAEWDELLSIVNEWEEP